MRNLTKMLAFGGVILAIFLMTIVRSNAAPGAAQPPKTTITPKITATLPFPTKTLRFVPSLPAGKQPPPCTFPLAQTSTDESIPRKYTFSKPEVVLSADAAIGVVEWLPDSQWALITQDIRDSNQQLITLFNPATGASQVYAKRTRIAFPPVWMEGLNAVIYPDVEIIKVTPRNNALPLVEFRRQLWMSQGDPKNATPIEDVLLNANALSYISLSVDPGSHNILYLLPDEKKFIKQNERLENKQAFVFNLAQWEYRSIKRDFPTPYSIVWRPNTTQIFLYTLGDVGGYTFLLDIASGQLCEMDFGGWAGIARWSPNGRYLAIIRAQEPLPINSSDLTVLDTTTGKQYTMNITPPEIEGRHAVLDIAWGPDNHHLLAIGYISPFPHHGPIKDENKYSGLHLVNFQTGHNIHVFPEYKFFADWWGKNIVWSQDGSQVLIRCPIKGTDRLCRISVQQVSQH